MCYGECLGLRMRREKLSDERSAETKNQVSWPFPRYDIFFFFEGGGGGGGGGGGEECLG